MASRSHTLNIHLIKDDVLAGQELDEEKVEALRELPIVKAGHHGTLYVKESQPNRPAWTKLFDEVPSFSKLKLFSASTGAVLLITVDGHRFALTFGQGRHLLAPGVVHERFGLITTLNAVKDGTPRSIDKKSFAAEVTKQVREQTSQGANTSVFGIDVEQDLLRAVVGTPEDPGLGTRVTGMDALVCTAKVELAQVPSLLARCTRTFHEKNYLERFPWVDHIAEVHDPATVAKLDDLLVDRLRAENFEKLWLAVPGIIDWSRVNGFRFTRAGAAGDQPDLHLRYFLDTVPNLSDIDPSMLRKRRAIAISEETGATYEQWSVYECICFEVLHDGHVYLLSGANWYRINQDFVVGVRTFYDNEIPKNVIVLPPYSHKDEGAYNDFVSTHVPGMALVDRKLVVHGGGHSTIEFCDLFSSTGGMIHTKRYGGSQPLSHLFSQGFVAAESFYLDPEFRCKANDKLPASHRLVDPRARIDPQRYEVVYAIISWTKKPLDLPFFSLVNLRNFTKRMMGYGYRVSVTSIVDQGARARMPAPLPARSPRRR